MRNTALLGGDWWRGAFAQRHPPLANRPLCCLSLVVDFAWFGPGPRGPQVMSLLIHLTNVFLLFAVLRRSLLAPNLAGRFYARWATRFAAAGTGLWVAHPLGCDAVASATQRSTLLWSGALLLGLYATLRAHDSTRAGAWRSLAVLAVALGMASKEDAVFGPLLVVLFERAFLLPSWSTLRPRRGHYGALAATSIVLGLCVALGPHNPTDGYSTASPVTAWHWLLKQAGVLVHYVRLAPTRVTAGW